MREQLERGIIIVGPDHMGCGKLALTHALSAQHHELLVIPNTTDHGENTYPRGSLEELISMKTKESQELLLNLEAIPHEEIILPPTKTTYNADYKKPHHYNSKPHHNFKKSFHHRKR